MIRPWLPFALTLISAPALALELPPGAIRTGTLTSAPAEFARDRFDGNQVPMIILPTGMRVEAWRITGDGQTNYQLLTSLLSQLTDDGYDILFQCQSVSCGGYDFRFAVGRFAAPELFIDLGSFQYATARKGDDMVGLLVSHGGTDGFVQISRTQDMANDAPVSAPSSTAGQAHPAGALAKRLLEQGHMVLDKVEFATGSAELAPGAADQLQEVARFLTDTPSARIALVGHTDTQGRLENNIALSRKRAQSVRRYLIDTHGIAGDRLQADGVGYLSPLTSNQTQDGRTANRRVEAVLLTIE